MGLIEIINELMEQLILPGTPPLVFWSFLIAGMLLQGIGKSGFAGGVGVLTFPMLCLVMQVNKVAAIMLPLLCLFDLNAIYHFRNDKDLSEIKRLIPYLLIGISLGSVFWFWAGAEGVDRFERPLKIYVGVIAVLFAAYILLKNSILQHLTSFRPGIKLTALNGITAGLTSTISHSAGPIVSFHMFVQGMSKSLFVGTCAWTFTFINYAKLPTYTFAGLFDKTNLIAALVLLPLVPAGSYLGKYLHERINEEAFNRVIMICVFFAGIQLISGVNVVLWMSGR